MNVQQLKKQAKIYLKENEIDKLLIEVYLEVKHYAAWAKNQDNDDWNCGLKNIDGEEYKQNFRYDVDKVDLVKASTEKYSFKIGGFFYTFGFDNDWDSYERVVFFIDDKLIADIIYKHIDKVDSILPSDFELYDVEEFHKDDRILDLLLEIQQLKKNKKERDGIRRKAEEAEKYKNKFTL